MRNCYDEVEAAILNSTGEPKEELRAALKALAKFGFTECDLTADSFVQMAEEAYLQVEQGK